MKHNHSEGSFVQLCRWVLVHACMRACECECVCGASAHSMHAGAEVCAHKGGAWGDVGVCVRKKEAPGVTCGVGGRHIATHNGRGEYGLFPAAFRDCFSVKKRSRCGGALVWVPGCLGGVSSCVCICQRATPRAGAPLGRERERARAAETSGSRGERGSIARADGGGRAAGAAT